MPATAHPILGAMAVMLLAVSCSSAGSGSTLTVRGSGTTYVVTDKNNGTTFQVRVGDVVEVTLHSTYWQIARVAGSVLSPEGPPSSAPGSGCRSSVPGSGCGTVTADYRVVASGSSTLRAPRESCGEAMRCTGSNGDWSVTIRATG